MKVPTIVSKLLTNKYVLYFIAFIAFTNVIGYIMLGNVNAVIYFILVGLITSYFSKNMTVVLLLALLITNLIVVNKMGVKEGMETSTTPEEEEKKQQITNAINNNPPKNESLPITPPQASQVTPTDESFVGKKGSKVDYATTVEDAYDNLNKIIGSEGMQKLTTDTQHLMKQQLQLAEAMKTMTPLIQNITPLLTQTKEMLGGMDMSHINNIASLAKGFTGG
jgi:hypothetical protein